MRKEENEVLNNILQSLDRFHAISPEEIPHINLYMDQLTGLLDAHLRAATCNPAGDKDDKILTKTMINNYAKNNLLPSPDNKKYNKEHLLILIVIYYLKGFLSISEIQALLNPITDRYFGSESDFGIEEIYAELVSTSAADMEHLKSELADVFTDSMEHFENAPKEDSSRLKLFGYVLRLCRDVYYKKRIIEQIIDSLRDSEEEP